MSKRFWFYLTAIVVIAGLYTWRLAVVNGVNNQIGRIEAAGQAERVGNLHRWVDAQKDERKLISLAKKLRYLDNASLQVLIDRAYALNPNSRDITILASQFHPEFKSKILELDPLYKP